MVLARSGNASGALATVEAALGLGGVTGSVLVSVWGGPQRRIHAVLAGAAASFFLGDLLFALGDAMVWVCAALCGAFFIPPIISANRSIWQAQVPPAVQGRVFAVQGMRQQISMPLGYLVAGPLADRVFEPAMQRGRMAQCHPGVSGGDGPGCGDGGDVPRYRVSGDSHEFERVPGAGCALR